MEQFTSSTTFLPGMNNNTYYPSNAQKILVYAENHLSWFYQQDLAEAITGERKRVKAVEYHLPRLVKKKKLTAVRDGKRLAYKYSGQEGKSKTNLKHDLICTKLILKFLLQGEGEVVAERFFQESKGRFGLVPDWAVLFKNSILLCEYSTADNCSRKRLMKNKVKQYKKRLPSFESFFEAPAAVLFILDVPRHEVKRFVNETESGDIFYFTDFALFINTARGEELDAPIYIWGGDGTSYPLRS